jgi:serine/threonine protein kinase
MISQIHSALRHMHAHRILHRDIKPENIVVQGDCVKLVDFGWATVMEGDSRSTFCGTPEYVSPEIVKGEHYN